MCTKIKEALMNLLDGKTDLVLTMIAVSPAVIVLGSASSEEKANCSKDKQARRWLRNGIFVSLKLDVVKASPARTAGWASPNF